jgi:hypothetical protein
MLKLTRIEPCESFGKYCLEIWTGEKYEHFHTDHLCVVERMQKIIENSFNKHKEQWIV